MALQGVKKILIVNLGGIGDLLLSLPSLRALKGAYPGAAIDITAVERVARQARRFNLFRYIFVAGGGPISWFSLLRWLRRENYDLVINMRTMVGLAGALKIRAMFWAIGGRIRAGRNTDGRGGFFDISIPETRVGDKHEMEYDIELAEKLGAVVSDRSIGLSPSPASTEKVRAALVEAGVGDGEVLIGIHPGGKRSHRWGLGKFAETMRRISTRSGCRFVVTGDADEVRLADELIGLSGVRAVNMAGRLDIDELGALIRLCRVFISNDTSAMHIAAALDVPTLAIFGPGYLARFDPRYLSKRSIVLYKGARCAPCDRQTCRTQRCLASITADDVVGAALLLLEYGAVEEKAKTAERGNMIEPLYRWLYRITARRDEKGEHFGGRLQGAVRRGALEFCRGARGKALEIGCGSGLFVLKLAAQEPQLEVWGVDTNAGLVRQVEEKAAQQRAGNLRVVCQDGTSLSFGDGTFDRVIGINLFLNLSDEVTQRLLREMARVCKDSGRIIFDFRSSRNLLFVLKYKLARFYDPSAPYPLYTHSPERIESMLAGAGLRVTGRKPLGLPPKWFAPIVIIEAAKI